MKFDDPKTAARLALALPPAIAVGITAGALIAASLVLLTTTVVTARGARAALRECAGYLDHGQVILAPALSQPVVRRVRQQAKFTA